MAAVPEATAMKILFTVFYDPKDLGIRYVASYMRQLGHEVCIVALKDTVGFVSGNFMVDENAVADCTLVYDATPTCFAMEPISDVELELLSEEVARFAPDMVGFGTRSKNFVHLPRIISALRRGAPGAFLVCGGAGPTIDPAYPLRLGVDAVIRGEGEYALADLVRHLENGADWRNTANISYLASEKLVSNPLRPYERNLDVFPHPALDQGILIEHDARAPLTRTHIDGSLRGGGFHHFVLGSRGCMGACSYCSGHFLRSLYADDGIKMPRVRRRSLDNVLQELVEARQNLNMGLVYFVDEFFVWPVKQLIDFFKKYKEQIGLPYYAYISADQLAASPELFTAVCEAGLMSYLIGVQSGDADFCRNMYQRSNNNAHILHAVEGMHQRGIPVQILLILGNALQGQESLRRNLDFIKQLPPFDFSFRRRIWFSIAKLFKPFDTAALAKKHPELWEPPFPSSQFYYDAMMVNFRYLLDDDAFARLFADPAYREQPHLLGKMYRDMLQERHLAHVRPEAQRLHGREVYFWGCGKGYAAHKSIFAETRPLAMLNDYPWTAPATVDGLPVLHPDRESLDTDKPLIIFARHTHVPTIAAKAAQKYGFKDIITCALVEDASKPCG